MLQYSDLNNDEKRTLRNILQIDRIGIYYLEDNGYMLIKEALVVINNIKETVIKEGDINKTIQEILVENHANVHKISSRVYLYKDNH